MPELPDITVYLEALEPRVTGHVLERIRIRSPFLLRSVEPPVEDLEGRRVIGLRRLGKRIVFALEEERFMVLHLMIAGRLRWKEPGAGISGKPGLAALDFPSGTLLLTEAGAKKRASLHLVCGETGLAAFHRGGVEVLETDLEGFQKAITRENRTMKRALTDPRLVSGIGNACSDEILHRAGLSPLGLTSRLRAEAVERLFIAAREVLEEWIDRLREAAGDGFPGELSREGMAVHGRYARPCPVCGTAVQRIVYAENECNYCPRCQTGGRVLADRSRSRLLKNDWPRTVEELEQRG